ncbi:MAG: hypothetical protein GX567_11895 [Clostridia bacterium]|nr:hypothetical protein [Clostridia bacterium]
MIVKSLIIIQKCVMSKYKIAMGILTANRSKHIKEDLNAIAAETYKRNIGIYIYDGSTDIKTEKVVSEFIDKGYHHVHYFHNNEHDDKKNFRDRASSLLSEMDAEYIWICGDKFTILPVNYEKILFYVDKDYDIITIYSKPINRTQCFSDPVLFLNYAIVPLTHWGSTIIRKELINNFNFIDIMSKCPSFWHVYMYAKAIEKQNFLGIVLFVNEKKLQLKARYHTRSRTLSHMWYSWIENWYKLIEILPRRYSRIKPNLYNRIDKDVHFFCLQELFRQRAENQFDFRKCLEYKQYISKVILLPNLLVYFISAIPTEIAGMIYKYIVL